ncbi:MAG: hypothetical protein ACOZCL_15050 [Bacillota bacterium]
MIDMTYKSEIENNKKLNSGLRINCEKSFVFCCTAYEYFGAGQKWLRLYMAGATGKNITNQ